MVAYYLNDQDQTDNLVVHYAESCTLRAGTNMHELPNSRILLFVGTAKSELLRNFAVRSTSLSLAADAAVVLPFAFFAQLLAGPGATGRYCLQESLSAVCHSAHYDQGHAEVLLHCHHWLDADCCRQAMKWGWHWEGFSWWAGGVSQSVDAIPAG